MIEKVLGEKVRNIVRENFGTEIDDDQLQFQPTRPEFEGEITFVVFPLVKMLRKSPQEIGDIIGRALVGEHVEAFQVVKGFLNLSIADQYWTGLFNTIVQDEKYGTKPFNGQKVMVEFSSPNTNKPLHLGHLRNNFLGDAVSRILEHQGYQVKKVNLVNDRGIHICKSMLAYTQFGNDESPETTGIKGDKLVGNYYVAFDKAYKEQQKELIKNGIPEEEAEKKASLLLEAQELLKKWEENDPETVTLWQKLNQWVYDGFDITYRRMGISFDEIMYESKTYLLGKDLVEEGLNAGIFYRREDGSVWIDLTEEGLDEKLLLRSDGTSVYMTQDLGTADLKYQGFNFEKSIYVVGNEQDYHFKVLFTILEKLGRNYASGLYHLSYGMVDLPSGKMKSREGTVVDADDLMDEMESTAAEKTAELGKVEGFSETELTELHRMLGLGALKFFLLKVDPRKRILFNPQESIEFQGYTGPFIQYTHARISAILRRAEEQHIDFREYTISTLQQEEKNLIVALADFPKVLEEAAGSYSPSAIAQYSFELAKQYNKFYTDLSILGAESEEARAFRVALSYAVARTLRSAMALLGIGCPERM